MASLGHTTYGDRHRLIGCPYRRNQMDHKSQNKCSINDCEGIARSRGWCQHHYNHWYRRGNPLSVGRIGREPRHGLSRTPEWEAWRKMKQRCFLATRKDYHRYGGRGITVCDRWLVFENFIMDMGLKPSPRHSIERKDNNGNYEPSNCVWALPIEQANNKVTNRILEYRGERLTISQWSRRVGMEHDTLSRRLKLGWSIKRALTAPLKKQRNNRRQAAA